MCAVVCSYCMSHQHLDAKIEPTFELLGKPIPKLVCSGWHLKQTEKWLLLSSMCAVVCSYCMSHQHLDAQIVKNFP